MGYRLNILGTLDLRDGDGTVVNSVLQQPRRTALLVYLALAEGDCMVKRDTLLGLFWPEMTQEAGRRALSQAIHFLRKSLGRDAIIGRGMEDLALNRARVDCDAARFLAAARAGELEKAAANYGGDLLPGFFVSGVPELDQWLSNERDALRRNAAEIFWSVAEEARVQGHTVSAAASARRAAELACENESATRRLMEFLESIDDRAGALDAYDGLARRLQVEFESTPSTRTREIADRIRRNGGAPPVESAPAPSSTIGRVRTLPWEDIRRRSKTLTGAVIIMIATLSLWGVGKRAGNVTDLRLDGSVVIDPAEVVDAAARIPAARVMSDAAAALVAVPTLTVFAESAPAEKAASAHFRLEPKITSDHGELRITANLVDASSGKIVRSAVFRAAANDTAALAASALDMAEFARKAMGRELRIARILTLKSDDAETLRESMLARIRSDSLRDQGVPDYALLTLNRADELLGRAIANRPSAELYVERAEIARARAWINLLPPLQNLAESDRASAAGVRFADAAIRLDPRNADARVIRGLFSYNQWLTPSAEIDPEIHRASAERYLKTAVELNPKAARAWSALASILIAKGSFTEAYWAAERALDADTYMDVADAVTGSLFTAALETGDLTAADQWCGAIARRSGNSWNGAFCSLQLIARADSPSAGEVTRAQLILAAVSESPVNRPFVPLLNSIMAVIYAKNGNASRVSPLLAASENGPLADEAQPYKAWALLELGGSREARLILDRYVAKYPSMRAGVRRSARFSALL